MDNSWSSNPRAVFDDGRQPTAEEAMRELSDLIFRVAVAKEVGNRMDEWADGYRRKLEKENDG